MLSAREGEVIVTTLHFSDVVHVDGRMPGALDEYVGALGCTDILADQLPSTKPFCGIASLALAALTRLLFGPHAAVETQIVLQTSVHAFASIDVCISLLPFRLSIVPPRPCLFFRGAVKKRHSRHGLKINPILDPLDRLPHLSRDPLRSACYPSCHTPLMARLRRGGCHRGLDRIS